MLTNANINGWDPGTLCGPTQPSLYQLKARAETTKKSAKLKSLGKAPASRKAGVTLCTPSQLFATLLRTSRRGHVLLTSQLCELQPCERTHMHPELGACGGDVVSKESLETARTLLR